MKKDLAVTYRNVADLVPYANNSRTHSEAQVAQIAASIKEFGFTNPVLVDGKNGIIAGHGRVMAAASLGMDQVPTIELLGLTAAQKRAYIIADNKLALNAGWDDGVLAEELKALGAEGFDLALTGFDDVELVPFLSGATASKGSEKADLSSEAERFEVIIECADEAEQERAFNLASGGGFECRISTF